MDPAPPGTTPSAPAVAVADEEPRRGWLYRVLARRGGLALMVLAATLVSVLASAGIAYGMTYGVLGGTMAADSWLITILCPLAIAPTVSSAMFALVRRLYDTQDQLQELTVRDGLTQLHNRRYFMQMLEAELQRLRRYGGVCSLAILDVDDFKRINDRHGHPVGDEVLCSVTQACRGSLRQTDVLARIGGEEFALLLRETDEEAARTLIERLRRTVAAQAGPRGDVSLKVTVSIGLVSVRPPVADLSEVLRGADQALYRAKRSGKDRTEVGRPDRAVSGLSA